MKIRGIVIIILMLISNYSFSQWNWVNPTPFGWNLYDVHFPDEQTGYIVGEKGVVLKSNDAGSSWEVKPTGILRNLKLVFFTDTETGYITSDSGFIMKSTDGGETWTELQSGTTEQINDIFFLNATTGFIAGMNGQLRRTTNGGETWQRAFIDMSKDINSVFFTNEFTGYASASMNTLYRTYDGGDSWTSVTDFSGNNLLSVFFVTENIGYISGSANKIMKTEDGGCTWSAFSSDRAVSSIQFVDDSTGFGIWFNHLVKTQNSGMTWSEIGQKSLLAFDIFTPTMLCSVGLNGNLIKSNDEGISFDSYTQSFIDESVRIRDASFPDVNTGYIIGYQFVPPSTNYGKIYKTSDSGGNWETIFDTVSDVFNSIFFLNANSGYITLNNGSVIKTLNGGITWETISNNTGLPLTNLYCLNNNTALASSGGEIYRTVDDCWHWDNVFYSCYHSIACLQFIDENSGFALVCDVDWFPTSDYIVKTENGGLDWSVISLPQNNGIFDMHFVNQNVGYCCGNNGDFFKTEDGGDTWTNIPFPESSNLLSLHFSDEKHGYLSAVNSAGYFLYQTIDGGLSWSCIPSITVQQGSFYFPESSTGFIISWHDIFKTTNGGLVFSEAHPVPESKISFFPNPANSTITINTADIANSLPLEIAVLNCNGRQVMKRKYWNIPAQMDISTLKTGIYLLRIETANTVEVRKLVKM